MRIIYRFRKRDVLYRKKQTKFERWKSNNCMSMGVDNRGFVRNRSRANRSLFFTLSQEVRPGERLVLKAQLVITIVLVDMSPSFQKVQANNSSGKEVSARGATYNRARRTRSLTPALSSPSSPPRSPFFFSFDTVEISRLYLFHRFSHLHPLAIIFFCHFWSDILNLIDRKCYIRNLRFQLFQFLN